MPFSRPDDWNRLFEDLQKHERDRESLGYSDPAPAGSPVEIPNLPRYEILERLGEGGTAVVFRALDRQLRRPVAFKFQRSGVARSEVGRERFRREVQAVAGLTHPHVVTVHDAGEVGGRPYLVMELVDGRPLSEILAEGKADPVALVGILEKAARGVAAAHEKGVVHRDLKPSNILVTKDGEPKIADFGLAHLVDSTAQLTRTGSSLGTPLYMSPEQVQGTAGAISPRTDVYALGAILYEILTGEPPHLGETIMEIYGRIVHDDPVAPRRRKPKVPGDLESIALMALEKDPRRRYPTAKEFADDLGRARAGEPIEARPPGLAVRTFRRLRKSRLVRAMALGAAAALLATVGIAVSGRDQSHRLRAEQEKRLSALRDYARTSLEAVLKLRRAGANAAMKDFVPGLEAAYRQALETDPDVAEVEYLLGRMHRALLEDTKALDFQERALRKDPRYPPALYERAVLLANRYGTALTKAIAEARRLPSGAATPRASRELPLPEPQDVERSQQDLLAVRERILADCTLLEERLARRPDGEFRQIGEAHLLTVKGILAFYRLEWPRARELLQQAVRQDPTLEEAWSALCETVYRQTNAEARRSSDVEGILRLWDEAENLYGQAIAKDRGYVPHWIGRADAKRHRGFTLMRHGRDAIPAFVEAEADLARAVELHHDFPDAWFLRASVRTMKGVCRMDRHQDPSDELEAAGEDLRIGTGLSGDRSTAWILKGSLHREWARWRQTRGESPLADYEATEAAYRRALAIDPQATQAWSGLATAKMARGEYRSRHGADPLPDYASAERDFQEVIRVERHTSDPWVKRGELYALRAFYRQGRGEAPLDDLGRADDDFSEAIRLNAGADRAYAERGQARLRIGRLRENSRDSARAASAYGEAAADFARAFALNPSLESEYGAEDRETRQKAQIVAPRK